MKHIEEYIRYYLCNPIAANRFIVQIEKMIHNLQFFPYSGAKYEKDSSRFKIYKNFLIFYEI